MQLYRILGPASLQSVSGEKEQFMLTLERCSHRLEEDSILRRVE